MCSLLGGILLAGQKKRLFPFDPAEFSGAGGGSPDSQDCGIFLRFVLL